MQSRRLWKKLLWCSIITPTYRKPPQFCSVDINNDLNDKYFSDHNVASTRRRLWRRCFATRFELHPIRSTNICNHVNVQYISNFVGLYWEKSVTTTFGNRTNKGIFKIVKQIKNDLLFLTIFSCYTGMFYVFVTDQTSMSYVILKYNNLIWLRSSWLGIIISINTFLKLQVKRSYSMQNIIILVWS